MKLLLDLNLSPDWVPVLTAAGWQACHWSAVGSLKAPDSLIQTWARRHHHLLITRGLDYPQLVYQTAAAGPSVILLRMRDEFDPAGRAAVVRAIEHAGDALKSGAILVISGQRARLRPLTLAGA